MSKSAEWKWTGYNHAFPKRWTFKKFMAAEHRPFARRINFGLFGWGWVAVSPIGAILFRETSPGNREFMLCCWFHLKTPGPVVGPRDRMAAEHQPWAEEWRAAFDAMIEDEMRLRDGSDQSKK